MKISIGYFDPGMVAHKAGARRLGFGMILGRALREWEQLPGKYMAWHGEFSLVVMRGIAELAAPGSFKDAFRDFVLIEDRIAEQEPDLHDPYVGLARLESDRQRHLKVGAAIGIRRIGTGAYKNRPARLADYVYARECAGTLPVEDGLRQRRWSRCVASLMAGGPRLMAGESLRSPAAEAIEHLGWVAAGGDFDDSPLRVLADAAEEAGVRTSLRAALEYRGLEPIQGGGSCSQS